MMTQVIYLSVISASLVLGWRIAIQEGMIFSRIRKWAENKKNEWKWIEGVLLCNWCAPSSWSVIAYIFGYLTGIVHGWKILIMYPVVVCISSISCGIIWMVIQLIDVMIKYYHKEDNQEENG